MKDMEMKDAGELRKITIRGDSVQVDSETIKLTNIVVRRGVLLPSLGERVVAVDEKRIMKFYGRVTRVDEENRSYDAELRKSLVNPLMRIEVRRVG